MFSLLTPSWLGGVLFTVASAVVCLSCVSQRHTERRRGNGGSRAYINPFCGQMGKILASGIAERGDVSPLVRPRRSTDKGRVGGGGPVTPGNLNSGKSQQLLVFRLVITLSMEPVDYGPQSHFPAGLMSVGPEHAHGRTEASKSQQTLLHGAACRYSPGPQCWFTHAVHHQAS